ncbi:endothelial zinc finger protein induced by tumor necrosis factor alpha-like [Limanda limanda]|uniref:endothelial zinc finger protein induced by tumor necrosis factor alpha-like n=1 Tax=Limanda limanda TaxID=27771 RepID=UPI0029C77018|nr:endothelial zinc finger protein induced by tumor necrosis factor alpha-like [Limanda limanda]
MLRVEALELQLCAVVEALLRGAVTELRRLMEEEDRADGRSVAAQQRSSPAAVKREEEVEVEEVSPLRQKLNGDTTTQFAALMETWTKAAVEKILTILKVSMCETEEEAEPSDQSTKPPERSAARRKKMEGGREPGIRKKNKRVNHKASHEERICGSEFEPDDLLTDLRSEPVPDSAPEPTSDVREDFTDASTSQITQRKKTTGSVECPSCPKTFALKCLMERHRRSHSKPHLCSHCGKRFSVLAGLIAHARRHTGEKLHKCSECGTEFAYKSTFVRHMRQHSLKTVDAHVCSLCETHFTDTLAFQRHRCCALNKTFVCSLCPETFQCRQSLSDHENLHSGARDFVCEMCGESFLSSSSLATHRVTHLEEESCCDQLGLGCSDLSVLTLHLSKHAGEKLFTCEVCGKGLSHQSALKHHMLTHTGERPYICETCGKRCSHASALQNHMRLHTGRKPGTLSACGVCGKEFRRTARLKYHMSVHTGEKPYVCDQCDKRFSNPSNLQLHRRSHSGEKRYGCNICGRRFTHPHSLKVHRLIHSGERPYRCGVCGKEFINRSDCRRHERVHRSEGGAGGALCENTEQ